MKPENAEFAADLLQIQAVGLTWQESIDTLIRDRDEALALAEWASSIAHWALDALAQQRGGVGATPELQLEVAA